MELSECLPHHKPASLGSYPGQPGAPQYKPKITDPFGEFVISPPVSELPLMPLHFFFFILEQQDVVMGFVFR